jgi:MFS family permease
MYASSLIVPQLLQMPAATGYGLGKSMLMAGLLMAPGGLAMMAVAPLGGKLTTRFGPKITLLTGTLIIAAGYASSLAMMGSAWTLMIVMVVIYGGVGFAYGAMPALIMGAVSPSETGAANSFNTVMRTVGTSVASAVVGLVLAKMTTQAGPVSFPSEGAFRTGMIIGGAVALLASLITLTIPYRKLTPRTGAKAPSMPLAPERETAARH